MLTIFTEAHHAFTEWCMGTRKVKGKEKVGYIRSIKLSQSAVTGRKLSSLHYE
jgi:hypothetical protein